MSNKKTKHTNHDFTLLSSSSPFAYSEAYKKLRTNLNFLNVDSELKCIAMTSALPNEGKSLTCVNLAITMAESGARVLLVDCDLRNPSLHRFLHLRTASGAGVSDLLSGKARLSECVGRHPTYGFDFAPAGTIPPNPSELLASQAMANLVERFTQEYDFVIIDTPPAGVVTDAAVVGHYTQGVVLVVRQKTSTKSDVHAALKSLTVGGAKIIGCVLNGYNFKADDAYYSKYSYQYSYNYRYKYGYGYGSAPEQKKPTENKEDEQKSNV